MVVALAGRRIDQLDAKPPRFPLDNVGLVERRLDELFDRLGAAGLVASAACGADLVALTVAGRRGMRRRVVLPFRQDEFRATSVTDRPGDWGPVYDRVLAELSSAGDVVTLAGHAPGDDDAYVAANHAILREAETMARALNTGVVAVLVWDGAPRGEGDLTAAFGKEARNGGWNLEEVMTL